MAEIVIGFDEHGKPMVISSGDASDEEINDAIRFAKEIEKGYSRASHGGR
jgi:hypothetical protein